MKTILVFSGAGLSAESGIQTFRDSNGLWENHKVEDVAHPSGWKKDKATVLRFYEERFHNVQNAQPNEAHKSIARLQEKFNVINMTQNIDDLLERAGCTDVRHLHGSLFRRKCSECNFSHMAQTEPVKLGDFCETCGSQMRPDVVWFEEAVTAFDYSAIIEIAKEIKYNDGVFICIGTSAQVHPAASLIPLFSQVKNKYIIDKVSRKIADYTMLEGLASEQMKQLADKLLEQ